MTLEDLKVGDAVALVLYNSRSKTSKLVRIEKITKRTPKLISVGTWEFNLEGSLRYSANSCSYIRLVTEEDVAEIESRERASAHVWIERKRVMGMFTGWYPAHVFTWSDDKLHIDMLTLKEYESCLHKGGTANVLIRHNRGLRCIEWPEGVVPYTGSNIDTIPIEVTDEVKKIVCKALLKMKLRDEAVEELMKSNGKGTKQ